MDYFVDTNVLLRALTPETEQGKAARRALRVLRRSNHRLCIFPQTLIEVWTVCTRPAPPTANGLGLSVAQTERYVRFSEDFCTLLLDQPQIHGEWRRLAAKHRVVGRQVFDARMVASMSIHGVSRALTFDSGHFSHYPNIEVIHPADLER